MQRKNVFEKQYLCVIYKVRRMIMQEVQIQGIIDEFLQISLTGDIHSVNAEEFYTTVTSAYNQMPANILFDCAELNFLDSTALGTFVKIFKTVKADGRTIKLINLQAKIKKLFVICSLDTIMEIA